MHANINENNSAQYFSLQQTIFIRIANLDKNNQKLLTFADSITKTSFMNTMKLENQIRFTLEGLIENIKEYFVDIDMKLRQLCSAVNQAMLENNVQCVQNNSQFIKQQKTSVLDILSDKVEELQSTLKKTQENQQKLVSIIENICEKHQIKEQASQIKPKIQFKQNIPKPKTPNIYKKPHYDPNQMYRNMKQSQTSIYDKLKGFADSSASMPIRQYPNQQGAGFKIKCRQQQFVSPNSKQKKSLKTAYQIKQSTASSNEGSIHSNNHNHRFKFLVQQLNKNS